MIVSYASLSHAFCFFFFFFFPPSFWKICSLETKQINFIPGTALSQLIKWASFLFLHIENIWKDFYRYWGWWYCTVREGIWNTARWKCFQGQHTWIHLVNWCLNPPVQGAKIQHKASHIPQMVLSSLFSKHFQVACLFLISQTLMGDIILASNYLLPSVHKPLTRRSGLGVKNVLCAFATQLLVRAQCKALPCSAVCLNSDTLTQATRVKKAALQFSP